VVGIGELLFRVSFATHWTSPVLKASLCGFVGILEAS